MDCFFFGLTPVIGDLIVYISFSTNAVIKRRDFYMEEFKSMGVYRV